MITLCHAAKGGSGSTLVACLRAIESPGPVLLVDLEGDIPGMLGLADPERPGIVEWLTSRAPSAHLDDLLIDVTPNAVLLPAHGVAGSVTRRSAIATAPAERWDEVVDWFTEWAHDTGGAIVVDAGTTPLPTSFVEQCPNRWLVTRACYLALRRATRLAVPPTGIVLIEEPGRALQHRDIEASVRAPIIATIPWDIRVARSVDAGLLGQRRLPRSINRSLSRVAA
ncbi:MAG: hypothetical protein ABJH68_05480 [Ilumatobacter sp.]|uniref:hypothetical protein n=1 Tax=Ilumatobacter sp. TaxID=1967498 RepID=UPI0032971F35